MIRVPKAKTNNRVVVLAVPVSDCHVVANRLLERFLAEEGYEVHNLGVCTPTAEIADAVARLDPLAVLVGSQNGHALQDLADLRARLTVCGARPNLPVYVGGNLTVGSDKSGVNVTEAFAEIGLSVVGTFEDALALLGTLDSTARRARREVPVG